MLICRVRVRGPQSRVEFRQKGRIVSFFTSACNLVWNFARVLARNLVWNCGRKAESFRFYLRMRGAVQIDRLVQM